MKINGIIVREMVGACVSKVSVRQDWALGCSTFSAGSFQICLQQTEKVLVLVRGRTARMKGSLLWKP